jgi:tRNA pseudouridine55 synthase
MRPKFLVMDKPEGITSHDVVAILRAVLGVKKVGHTGTLDPFATGVLPLALGPATRLIQYLDEDLKVYDATIQLGAATDTGDPTGTVNREAAIPEVSDEALAVLLASFIGTRMQTPPRYSAVKVKGRPLYAYAREGKDVAAKPRPIRIDSVDLLDRGADWLRVQITCGRGTYARVLADDIAIAMGTAGHLTALRRTRSGPFTDSMALSIHELSQMVAGRQDWQPVLRPARGAERVDWRPRDQVRAEITPHLVPVLQALGHLTVVDVPHPLRARVLNGGPVPPPPAGVDVGDRSLLATGDELLAVAEREERGPKALRIMPPN